MTVFVCLDDANGMMFHGRRQSKDQVLRSRMLSACNGQPLWMNGYSAKQFDEGDLIEIHDDFFETMPQDGYGFAEEPYMFEKADALVVFRWNRRYPADVFFPTAVLDGYTVVSQQNFVGSSHDMITQTVYVKRTEGTK